MRFFMSSSLKGPKARTHFSVGSIPPAMLAPMCAPYGEESVPDIAEVRTKLHPRHRKALDRVNAMWSDKYGPERTLSIYLYDRKGKLLGGLYFNPEKLKE